MIQIQNVKKIKRKLCRALAKSQYIPNRVRIALLRKTGMKIGKSVVINEGFTLVSDIGWEEHVVIEDRVAIASNVTIVATSHPNHSILHNYSRDYPFIEVFGDVKICHDSWIGAGVIVLPNVSIGSCSVIGAGAVVTRSIKEKCVAAGVPAKVIHEIQFGDNQ